MPKILDHIMKESSHRTIKILLFLVSERYSLHIYCHGIENLWHFCENICPKLLRVVKLPLCIVLGEESLYDLIQCFRLFFSHFAAMKFCRVEFTYISSARKKVRKISKILRSFGFLLEHTTSINNLVLEIIQNSFI